MGELGNTSNITVILQIITILFAIFSLIYSTSVTRKENKTARFIETITKERIEMLECMRKNYAQILALSRPEVLSMIGKDIELKRRQIMKIEKSIGRIQGIFCNIYEDEREINRLGSDILELTILFLHNPSEEVKEKLTEKRISFVEKCDIYDHAYWFFIMNQTGENGNMGNNTFVDYYNKTTKRYQKLKKEGKL